MQYIKIILVTVVFAISAKTTIAQEELYKKYSDVEGVTRVYISEAMFSLFKGTDLAMTALGTSDVVDVGGIIDHLTGLYILTSNEQSASERLEIDFNLLMQKFKLELLMEVEDNSDVVKMYVLRKGDIIKNFFLKVKEGNGSVTILFFKGDIPESKLAKIINSGN